ncbi:MAG: patatin-like phospholipase family protein [Acetobacteraceae bacterium]
MGVVDVAMATAAAPTYFPAHTLQIGSTLVDGGVWTNNPTGLAVVEGIAVLGWKPDEIRVLSLGCTDQPLALPKRASAGWFHLPHVIELMSRGQAEGSLGTAKLLLNHSETDPRLFRRTQVVNRATFSLDCAGAVRHLAGLGREDARQFLPTFRKVFSEHRRDAFVPFHGLRSAIFETA